MVGYLPLGFLLALALLRSGPLAWLAGLLAPALLSLLMEGLQSYLPQRVPSQLDLLLNAAGGATGALLALLSARLRLVRIDRFREEWRHHEPPLGFMSYCCSCRWRCFYRRRCPHGLGLLAARAIRAVEWLQDTPFAHWLPAPVAAPPLSPLLLALAIALSLVAPLLLGFALLPRPRQRIWLQLVWSLAAPAALESSRLCLTHGMARVWDVFAAGRLGLALAFMLALAGLRLCRAGPVPCCCCWRSGLRSACSTVRRKALLRRGDDAWSGGPFMRVHGLSRWLGWLWPYAALGVGLRLALRVPSRHYNAPT